MKLNKNVKVINVGLELFYLELQKQDCEVVNVEWSPPQKISKATLDFLNKLR